MARTNGIINTNPKLYGAVQIDNFESFKEASLFENSFVCDQKRSVDFKPDSIVHPLFKYYAQNQISNNSTLIPTLLGLGMSMTISPLASLFLWGGLNGCSNDDDGDLLDGMGGKYRFYLDSDGDGFGNPSRDIQADDMPEGYVINSKDCDDENPNIHPKAEEKCNEVDEDCDGIVDEGFEKFNVCRDNDDDGYGDLSECSMQCYLPEGYVLRAGDCNDTSASVHAGAQEICNEIDDDCDGEVDEDFVGVLRYPDLDGDGYGDENAAIDACDAPEEYILRNGDCDDGKAEVNPEAGEQCNGIDDNCNDDIDEGFDRTTYSIDTDGDGFGDRFSSVEACVSPPLAVENAKDCDDTDHSIHPDLNGVCISEELKVGFNAHDLNYSAVWTGEDFAIATVEADNRLHLVTVNKGGNSINEDMVIAELESNNIYISNMLSVNGRIVLAYKSGWGKIFFIGIDENREIYEHNRISNSNSVLYVTELIWTGSEYGICWVDRDGRIYFTRLNANGRKQGGDILIADIPIENGKYYQPELIWTGDKFVLFGITDYPDMFDRIFMTTFDEFGENILQPPYLAGEYTYEENSKMQIAWGANNFALVQDSGSGISLNLFRHNGEYLDYVTITDREDAHITGLAWDGQRYFLSWSNHANFEPRDYTSSLYLSILNEAGQREMDDIEITTSVDDERMIVSDNNIAFLWDDSHLYFTQVFID